MSGTIKLINSVTGEEENIDLVQAEIAAKRSDAFPLELSRSGDRKIKLLSDPYSTFSMRRMLDGSYCGFLDDIEVDLDTVGPGGLDEGTMVAGDMCYIYGVESPTVADNMVLVASKNPVRPKGFANAVYQGGVPIGSDGNVVKFSHTGFLFERHERKLIDSAKWSQIVQNKVEIDLSPHIPANVFSAQFEMAVSGEKGRIELFTTDAHDPRAGVYLEQHNDRVIRMISIPIRDNKIHRRILDGDESTNYALYLLNWTDGRMV